jgi:6-pyruvoyltetrahydropterin/6-carboxytetrahydropterin synthase
MSVRVTKQLEFAASHTYSVPGASPEENERLFGACVRHHGHNYMLHVTVEGDTDPRTGMVVNVTDLKKAMQDAVAELDHRHLNRDVEHFRRNNPSTENIALYLFEKLRSKVAPARLRTVRLHEDESLSVEVHDA